MPTIYANCNEGLLILYFSYEIIANMEDNRWRYDLLSFTGCRLDPQSHEITRQARNEGGYSTYFFKILDNQHNISVF